MSVAREREEVFGPVFTMLTYDDMDDAVAIP
jgi:acyl-CoA reductase-like NAD-dependent aldehyde dehydrogenase